LFSIIIRKCSVDPTSNISTTVIHPHHNQVIINIIIILGSKWTPSSLKSPGMNLLNIININNIIHLSQEQQQSSPSVPTAAVVVLVVVVASPTGTTRPHLPFDVDF
jgi:hypothetical protein